MAISIWTERTKTMRNAETIAEASREYVEWLDWIVGSLEDETSAEDFDALYERWVFSGAWKKIEEEAPELYTSLNCLSDAALEICEGARNGFMNDQFEEVLYSVFYGARDRCFELIDALK